MDRDDVISAIISDAEAIKVLVDDMPDMLPLAEQHRLHAIALLAEDLRRKVSEI